MEPWFVHYAERTALVVRSADVATENWELGAKENALLPWCLVVSGIINFT